VNKELTKEEAEEFYNKLWVENKELIQENIGKTNTERFELELELVDKDKEIERLHSIIKEAKDYIRSKSIKFTMAYVEDDGRIDLSRSDYRIDKLTSKQVKELLEILDKENKE